MQGLWVASASAACHCTSCCRSYPSRFSNVPASLHLRRSSLLLAAATLEENAAENNAGAKVVKVKFQLQKRCEFGQQFNVVGDDEKFGAWDPTAAIPMEWSEGNIWTTELDISVGKRVEFKVILTGMHGELEWQPGPNRVLEISEGLSSLLISESWSDEHILHHVPLAHTPEMNNRSDVQAHDALVVSDGTFPDTVDDTADIASKVLDADEIIVDNVGELTSNNEALDADEIIIDNVGELTSNNDASDALVPSDLELPIASMPVNSESQDLEKSIMEEDSNKDPEAKLSVLEKDLNWGRKAFSTFWWPFRQDHGEAQR